MYELAILIGLSGRLLIGLVSFETVAVAGLISQGARPASLVAAAAAN
jgi:hypothetical protein